MIYDVIILGSGISGSILAAITARHGLSTLMIDHGRHPRFTVGESMIPGTSYMLRILADRYEVPELDQVSTFLKLRRHVTSSSGIKRNFSFVHHALGKPFDPAQSTMLPIMHYPDGPESHLMRQDVDAFLFAAAVRYGSDALQDTAVTEIDLTDEIWTLKTKCGRTVRTKYLVDGSGHNSVLAKRYGWREEPTRLQTHSRSIFTHMVGVRPFDDFYSQKEHGLPQPLSQGTLHHIFDGGWLWVIPFDNYESAGNPLCSVGLQLDPRMFPADPEGPEAEFRKFIAQYPEIAVQFEHARAVRTWISAPRLQYSSSKVVGDRCFLSPHSAGFVDPLFSRGLHITMESINALAHRLIDAARADDFSRERFESLDHFTQSLIDSHDRLAHGSFVAFRDFDLWNAWYRVWALGGAYSSLRYRRAHIHYRLTKDRRYLDELENHQYLGTPCPEMAEYQELFQAAYAIMREVEAERLTNQQAIAQLYDLYRDKPWIPAIHQLDNPAQRFVTAGDLKSLVRATYWGYRQAPKHVRERYFDFSPLEIAKEVVAAMIEESRFMRHVRSASWYPRFDKYRSAQSPCYALLSRLRAEREPTTRRPEARPKSAASMSKSGRMTATNGVARPMA